MGLRGLYYKIRTNVKLVFERFHESDRAKSSLPMRYAFNETIELIKKGDNKCPIVQEK